MNIHDEYLNINISAHILKGRSRQNIPVYLKQNFSDFIEIIDPESLPSLPRSVTVRISLFSKKRINSALPLS